MFEGTGFGLYGIVAKTQSRRAVGEPPFLGVTPVVSFGFRTRRRNEFGIEGESPKRENRLGEDMAKEITVEGMNCGGCEETVEDALRDVPGVEDAAADNEADSVTVEGEASDEDIAAAVEDAGFTAKV
jgi:copper chaperone